MPSIGSGLGAVCRATVEPSYGNGYGATFDWIPIVDFKATLQPNFQQGSSLKYVQTAQSVNTVGSLVHSEYERVWSAADVTGSLTTYMFQSTMGMLYAGIMGGNMATLAPTVVDTTVQAWSFPLASAYGSSLAFYVHIPNTSGTLDVWTVHGVKITELAVTGEVGALPTCTWTIDGQDRTLNVTNSNPGAPSYVAGNQVYGFPGMEIFVNGLTSANLLDGIEKVSFSIKRGYQTARYTSAGQTSVNAPGYKLKEEPIENGFFDISGTLDTEFISTASFVDNFMSQATFALYPQWNNGTIPGSSPSSTYTTRFTFPVCRYTGGDPTIDGPDIVKPSLPFIVLNGESGAPATISYNTIDTTL